MNINLINNEKNSVDLIVSIKVLPFLEKDIFYTTIEKIKSNLNDHGVIVLNFFGEEDDWQDLTLVSKNEIAGLFKEFEIYYLKKQFQKELPLLKTVNNSFD
ncbi:MAG: cyclopropane fatty-acyl-phospholipid synthase-like methyltransferase [Planctomycetota bacterium]|jgi:cyclopropane fatty-acyl-phospholipid synthase-like methyltransferase